VWDTLCLVDGRQAQDRDPYAVDKRHKGHHTVYYRK
jgi:hypothetical protein